MGTGPHVPDGHRSIGPRVGGGPGWAVGYRMTVPRIARMGVVAHTAREVSPRPDAPGAGPQAGHPTPRIAPGRACGSRWSRTGCRRAPTSRPRRGGRRASPKAAPDGPPSRRAPRRPVGRRAEAGEHDVAVVQGGRHRRPPHRPPAATARDRLDPARAARRRSSVGGSQNDHLPGRTHADPVPHSPPAAGGHRALRPPLRRVRPGPGAHRGRVGQGHPGEVPGQRRPGVPHPRADRSRSSAPTWSSTTCGCCGPTTSSRRTSRSTRSCTSCSTRPPRPPAAAPAAKASTDPATGQELLDLIAQIDKIFWETKAAS